MTPGARVAAAIEILDGMTDGLAAEQALTRWARNSRFAGAKDRAAIRDHVFDVLRRRDEARDLGGGSTGRAMMLGLLRAQGIDPYSLFTGEGHAPGPLTDAETGPRDTASDTKTHWNLPPWLVDHFEASLGPDALPTALALQERAPVCLRVNRAKTSVDEARTTLSEQGIETSLNPLSPLALTVTSGARKIRNSQAFQDGLVELQDAASQAVVEALPQGGKVLDYCAGGGGKALALAMDATRQVFAHDIDPKRMQDLPRRAERAGVRIVQVSTDQLARERFDVVLCDAPCSGSGAWRRAAQGKWTLTPARLSALTAIQDDILNRAARLVRPKGLLAYATCSVLRTENEDRVGGFVKNNPGWKCDFSKRFQVDENGDGFFATHLTRD